MYYLLLGESYKQLISRTLNGQKQGGSPSFLLRLGIDSYQKS